MKSLITFATEREARATIAFMDAQKRSEQLYASTTSDILITGMGLINAAASTMRYAPGYAEIWNLGIAGALKDKWKTGEILSVGTVERYYHFPMAIDEYSQTFAENISPELKVGEGVRLISADYPLHHRPESCHADLVDMEAYSIVLVANSLSIPCYLHKCISDFANCDGPSSIRSVIDTLSEQIAADIPALVQTQ